MSSHSIAVYTGFSQPLMEELISSLKETFVVQFVDQSLDYRAKIWCFRGRNCLAIWIRKIGTEPYQKYLEIGTMLKCTWVHLLFQEKINWGYVMYSGDVATQGFSPRQELFGSYQAESVDAIALANAWNVDLDKIQDYLQQWKKMDVGKMAYPNFDHFAIGSFEQGYDFLASLTGIRVPE